MTLFQRHDIDLKAERARVAATSYSKRQRKALFTLYDLFERGEWQACLDHIRSAAFPYNSKGGYPEVEHIGTEVSDILHKLGYANFYTADQIKQEARQ